VKGRLDLAVDDLGRKDMKNIAEPIRVCSLRVGVPAQTKPATEAKPNEKAAGSQSWLRAVSGHVVSATATAPGRGVGLKRLVFLAAPWVSGMRETRASGEEPTIGSPARMCLSKRAIRMG
jgi:hypothetical protein